MLKNKGELRERVKQWLVDEDLLRRTRAFLGGDGLGESKIANWNKPDRGIPDTFLEGAALYHCAENELIADRAAKKFGLIGECFWQVFVVSPTPHRETGNHDCLVIRLWEQVEPYGGQKRELHFATKTWFTGDFPCDSSPVFDLVTNEALSQKTGLSPDQEHEILLRWKVEGVRRDYGYSIYLPNTIAGTQSDKQRFDYVVGLPVIPVKSAVIMTILPDRIRAKKRGDDDPFAPESPILQEPKALGFHAQDDPLETIERVLGREWQLASWIDTDPGAVELWRESNMEIPEKIRNALTDIRRPAEVRLTEADIKTRSKADHSIFVTRISFPEPLLHYGFYFKLPESEQEGGQL